jgi:hypothetical protein
MRRRIMKRIERTTLIAVHEAQSKRKSPKTRPYPSSLRKPDEHIPGDFTPKRPRLPRHNHVHFKPCASASA